MVIIIAAFSGFESNAVTIAVRCYAMVVAVAVDAHPGLLTLKGWLNYWPFNLVSDLCP